jgi:thymidylate synthase (FAD)
VREVKPKVYLVARTQPTWNGLESYLREVGGQEWLDRVEGGAPGSAEDLVEFAGRLCYRSWAPGLNPNVSKIRTDQDEYLRNILKQLHGSVLEHASYSFVFHNVSRVLTHELVRHRAGTAVSQESMRYVRLTDIPFWVPEWAGQDAEFREHAENLVARMEWFQVWMTHHFGLENEGTPFGVKKAVTSFMRRFAPNGVATSVMWTANVRTLRHVIETRTAPGAEEEIRLVFGDVARIMQAEAPALFGDFTERDGSWVPEWSKV